jgi:CDGSH-type Zn-finger protein
MEQPESAAKAPIMTDLEQGNRYAWCSCGKSDGQPWCNGAHQGSTFAPKVFTAESTGPAAMCACKLTKTPPFCDGSHRQIA